MVRIRCFLLVALGSAAGFGVVRSQDKGPAKIDFVHDVAPLIKARCAECHTNGKYKGSVSMDTRADLLKSKVAVSGKSADSGLVPFSADDFRVASPSAQ